MQPALLRHDCRTDEAYWDTPSNEASDDFYWDLAHRELYRVFLSRYARRGEVLLDVGCGRGYFVAACREAGVRADGIDVSRAAVEWARDRTALSSHRGG